MRRDVTLPEWLRLVIVFYHARLLALEVDDSVGIGMFAFEVCGNFGGVGSRRVFPGEDLVHVFHRNGEERSVYSL